MGLIVKLIRKYIKMCSSFEYRHDDDNDNNNNRNNNNDNGSETSCRREQLEASPFCAVNGARIDRTSIGTHFFRTNAVHTGHLVSL